MHEPSISHTSHNMYSIPWLLHILTLPNKAPVFPSLVPRPWKLMNIFRTAISLLASQFAKRPALRESATNDCQYQTWVSKVHRTTHQKTRPKTKDQAPCGSSIRERSTHQQCTVMVPWQNANHYASKHTKGFVPKVGANRLQHVICRKAMCCNIRIALHCLCTVY